jgi:hypothetical protein
MYRPSLAFTKNSFAVLKVIMALGGSYDDCKNPAVDENPTIRLEDTNVLWYHLPIASLLNAYTLLQGEYPMSKRLAR